MTCCSRTSRAIYERVDFRWMLAGHLHLLSMGWKPERGFLEARWKHCCELMILYLLGIGSPTHPLPATARHAWDRPVMRFRDFRYIGHADPLFVHQYSHAWVDFRGRREARPPRVDWWENGSPRRVRTSVLSGLLGRVSRVRGRRVGHHRVGQREGIRRVGRPATARGHRRYGGALRGGGVVDVRAGHHGPVARTLATRWGDRVYGRYGFIDAFHPATGWTNPDVTGIDGGVTLLAAENLRTGAVWRWFMANPEIPRALQAVGLV